MIRILEDKYSDLLSTRMRYAKEPTKTGELLNDIQNKREELKKYIEENFEYDPETKTVIKYIGKGGKVKIPEGTKVIGDYAFSTNNTNNITSIVIPNSVTTIGNSAFSGWHNLTNMNIPNGVTTIGDYAFYYCDYLRSLTIPNSVTTIGKSAFAYCFKLTSIEIPNSVTEISNGAFRKCENLSSVNILNGVKVIGNDAFADCWSLKSIEIPDSVTKIRSRAFEDSGLTDVTMSENVKYMSSTVFNGTPFEETKKYQELVDRGIIK